MVKPKPNPKSTEEMPIERSVFNKDMATISNPIPIMTKRSVFSLKEQARDEQGDNVSEGCADKERYGDSHVSEYEIV